MQLNSVKRMRRSSSIDKRPQVIHNSVLPPISNQNEEEIVNGMRIRIQNEKLFDDLIDKCNFFPINIAFEPVLLLAFEAECVIVWLKEQNYFISRTLDIKVNENDTYISNVLLNKDIDRIEIVPQDDGFMKLQIMENQSAIFIPLLLKDNTVIGVVQITRDSSTFRFSEFDEQRARFLMRKFTIYGSTMLGVPHRIAFASEFSKIAESTVSVNHIIVSLKRYFNFEQIEFWYLKIKNEDYMKYDFKRNRFLSVMRCNSGLIGKSLRERLSQNILINSEKKVHGAPVFFVPLMISTCDFEGCTWATVLKGIPEHAQFSDPQFLMLKSIIPFIARVLAFSSGVTPTPTAPSETNDTRLSKLLDASSSIIGSFDELNIIKSAEYHAASLTGSEKARFLLIDHEKKEIHCDFGVDLLHYVMYEFSTSISFESYLNKIPIRIQNPSDDTRYRKDIDTGGAENVTSLIAVPVPNTKGDILGVICCYNKMKSPCFIDNDEIDLLSIATIAGTALMKSKRFFKPFQLSSIFPKNHETKSHNTTFHEYSNIFEDIFRLSSNFCSNVEISIFFKDDATNEFSLVVSHGENRDPNKQYCISTANDKKDKVFHIKGSSMSNNEHSSGNHIIACFPLFDQELLIGVLEVVSLSSNISEEVQFLQTVTSMTRYMINKSKIRHLYDNWNKNNYVRTIITPDEWNQYVFPETMLMPTERKLFFLADDFDSSLLCELDHYRLVFFGFSRLNLIEELKIPCNVLFHFISMISSKYKPDNRRNWIHAMNVFQFTFCTLIKDDWAEVTKLEAFASLIASLALGLSRPDPKTSINSINESSIIGTPGYFEYQSCASLIEILDLEESNIMVSFSKDSCRKALKLVFNLLLATDISKHFEIIDNFTNILEDGEFLTVLKPQRHSLLHLLIKCADFNAITKPFTVAQKYKESLYEEFFQIGDFLRTKGIVFNGDPLRCNIQKEQSMEGFLSYIISPLFSIVSKVIPSFESVSTTVSNNIGAFLKEQQPD